MISWSSVLTWINDPLNWQASLNSPGIPAQIGHHLYYSLVALVIAGLIGVPAGLLIGHTGRAAWLVTIANGVRSLPTVGLLILFYVLLAPHISGRGDAVYLIPTEIVLVLLAVPPLLANTYAGIQNVGPEVRDAARGMGMTGGQVLWRVEVPNALPLMFSGLRGATLQVIATATVAAYVGLGGLGRFVYDGLSQRDFPQMVGGAIIVALTALLADLVLAGLQRIVVSRGVSGRFRTRSRRGAGAGSGGRKRGGLAGSAGSRRSGDARATEVEQLQGASA